MDLSRRSVLRLANGGAIALTLGAGGCGSPESRDARAPWREAAESNPDIRLTALGYGVLAPNPHNRQPWLFDLDGDDAVTVYCDLDRRLPHTDPYDRQITIGFGCMLELTRMAAAQHGHLADIEFFPDGEPQPRLDEHPVARIRFVRSTNVAPDLDLFTHVLARHTNREPFDTTRPVEESVLASVIDAAGSRERIRATVDAAHIEELQHLTWRAFEIEAQTHRTWMESVELMRIGRGEVDANPDGIAIEGPMMGLLQSVGIVTREAIADTNTRAYHQGVDQFRVAIETAMGFVWITTAGNRRIDQIEAGRDWVRLHLGAVGAGLALHPLSQALQEYHEMEAEYAEVHDRLASDGATVQMLGRIGYGPAVSPAPRWRLQEKLIDRDNAAR